MEKYKDFQELPNDYNEGDLSNLFVKRNYLKRIEHPKADDIIIGSAGINGKEIYSNLNMDVSTLKERMSFEKGTSVAYLLPETTDIDSAKFEISFLNPSEIEDYYLRKRVEAYLKICKEILYEERQSIKPFHKFLKNIPDDKINDFAEELKKDFPNTQSIDMRYMVEGLKNLNILVIEKGQMKKVFYSMKKYFAPDIGTYESIFTMPKLYKEDWMKPGTAGALHYSHIKTAEMQICSILKKLHIKIK
jgi:hypothetical protein